MREGAGEEGEMDNRVSGQMKSRVGTEEAKIDSKRTGSYEIKSRGTKWQ